MKKTPNGIKRGTYIFDPITNAEGYCVGLLELLNGSIQVGIQPEMTEGKLPDTVWVDYFAVEINADRPEIALEKRDKLLPISLGDELMDTASGFKGTAIERLIHTNGCVGYGLVGISKDGKKPETIFVDQHRLAKVETFGSTPIPSTKSTTKGGAATVSERKTFS